MDYAQQQREPGQHASGLLIVLALHLALGWALANGLGKRLVEVIRAPIVTRIIDEVRPPPEPQKPLPPPPKVALLQPSLLPPPDIRVSPPPEMPQTPAPVSTAALRPLPSAAPAPVAPSTSPPEPAPVLPPLPPPPPRVSAGAAARNPDEVYLGDLRTYLNSIKRYPTSREARQLRPQGTVKLWIEIDRAGQLLGAGVETSAGTLLLDNEALRTVRNGRFPAFPDAAFAGQPSRRFVVPIEYLPAAGG